MVQKVELPSARSPWWFWLFVLGFFACLGLYFWRIPFHPIQSITCLVNSFEYSPWTWPQVFRVWFRHFLLLITFITTLIVFQGTGNCLLRGFGFFRLEALENWVWSLALGFGFWGLLAEGLAFENLFYMSLMKTLLLMALTGFLLLERLEAIKRCWPFNIRAEIPSFWFWPIAVVFLLSLSNLLAPEMSWDAITYQLILPKYYFINHGFYPVTGIVPAHYPSLGQMIFSWGLLWDNDSLARSFCFLAHIGTALTLVALGSRLLTSKIGWMAGVFYWVFPYLNIFSTRGYVDLFTGLYVVLGLGYLMVWAEPREEKAGDMTLGWLAATALGLIWAFKYNAIAYSAAGIIIFILGFKRGKKSFEIGAWLLAAPAFFFVPWALKSWLYTRNPIYPHLSQFFQTFDWTDFDAKASAIKFQVEGFGGLFKLPLLLWNITFNNYSGAPNEEISLIPLVLSPVLLVFLFLKWKSIRWKYEFLAVIGVPLIFWLVTTHQLRLVSGVIALASIPLSAAYQWVVSYWERFEKAIHLLTGIVFWVCALYLFQGLANQPTPFAYALGFQSRDDFLNHVLRPQGYMVVAETLNRSLSTDSKVLIIGQQNGYYLERISAYDFDYTYPVLKKWSEKTKTPEGLYKQFKENGFTHILYNANSSLGTAIRVDELGVDRYPWKPQELKNYEQFFLKFTREIPLPVGDGYYLYEIGPRKGFSNLPDYLPGTEHYYLKDMQEIMELPKLTDMIGKPISSGVYLQTYQRISEQHVELGLPCFQWAFGSLGSSPENTRAALQRGQVGFSRNGDEASWDALQGDYYLSEKKTAHAIPLLERAQQLSPEKEDVARNLAVAYYNEHNLRKAVEEADRAAALAPYSQELLQLSQRLRSLAQQ